MFDLKKKNLKKTAKVSLCFLTLKKMLADHYRGVVHIGADHVLHECILTLAEYAVEDLDKNARRLIAKGLRMPHDPTSPSHLFSQRKGNYTALTERLSCTISKVGCSKR